MGSFASWPSASMITSSSLAAIAIAAAARMLGSSGVAAIATTGPLLRTMDGGTSMTAPAERKAACKSQMNCWVARSAGLSGSTIMTMSSVREIDEIVSAMGPRTSSNWYRVVRCLAASVNIRSMLRAASSKSRDSRSRSIACQPPPSGLSSRAKGIFAKSCRLVSSINNPSRSRCSKSASSTPSRTVRSGALGCRPSTRRLKLCGSIGMINWRGASPWFG